MDRPDVVDQLSLRLYEAAADPEQWPCLIEDIAASVGGHSGGAFFVWDHAAKGFVFAAYAGIDMEHERLYNTYYGAIDPREAIMQTFPVGMVFRCHEHLDEDFVRRSEYFNDFALPTGSRYLISAKLSPGEAVAAHLSFGRDTAHGQFDDASTQNYRRLVPHAMRAAQIARRFMLLRADKDRAGAALDAVSWGVIVTDALGNVLMANAAAERRLRGSDGLTTVKGKLSTLRIQDSAALAALILRTALAGGSVGSQAGGALTVERPGRAPLNLLAAPLMSDAAASLGVRSSSVIIFVTDPQRTGRTPASVLQSLYQLTPAEAEVALALADGLSIEQIADARSRRRQTIRQQVKMVLAKTGATRQAELVRLVLSLPALSRREPGGT